MAVVLFITTNNGQTTELPLLSKCTVGRSSHSDFKIDDKQMSGKHGVFELNHQGELFYTDLGSTNGSYLNNSQIQKIQFKVSETLRLGNTLITIDEKKLNSRERLAIGKGLTGDATTLLIPTKSQSFDSKPSKKKIPKSNWESNAGKTKILKLDINKHKKK